jgi:outer membrane biosynthesis protein TonB
MSPEQAEGQAVDARTDQFALGIVFWELLTMRRLFKRDSEVLTLEAITEGQIPRVKRFREDCPAGVEDIVMTALARDKNRRFRDCNEMALALEDALSKESIVHSQSRLSQYMRRLFADQLAEEAAIGVVQPDGSLSAKNTFPIHDKRKEAAADDRVEKPAKEAPREADVVEKEAPPPDATQADRRRTKSKTNTQTDSRKPNEKEKPKEKKPEPRSAEAKPEPRSSPESRSREREPDRDQGRDRDGDRGVERAIAKPARAPMLIAAVVGGVAVAAVGVVVAVVMSSSDGASNMVVRSEPRGARVFVDDVDTQQTTPALIKNVRSGEPHKVRLELSGHPALQEIVTIPKKGMTHEVTLNLPPATP